MPKQPSHRNLKHRNRPRGLCMCGKVSYATQDDARNQLGHIARQQHLSGGRLYAMQAYKCPAGLWHLGRNGDTVKKIEKFLNKKTEKQRQAQQKETP